MASLTFGSNSKLNEDGLATHNLMDAELFGDISSNNAVAKEDPQITAERDPYS